MKALSWIFVLAGIWLIIAPFVLAYEGAARWNDIVLGLIVGILGLISMGGNNSAPSQP